MVWLVVRPALQRGWCTQCHCNEENWLSLSQKLPIANTFLDKCGTFTQFPSSMLGFSFGSSLYRPCAVSMGFYMHLSGGIWETLLKSLPPLTLTIPLALLPHRSPPLRAGRDKDIPFRAEHSQVSHSAVTSYFSCEEICQFLKTGGGKQNSLLC